MLCEFDYTASERRDGLLKLTCRVCQRATPWVAGDTIKIVRTCGDATQRQQQSLWPEDSLPARIRWRGKPGTALKDLLVSYRIRISADDACGCRELAKRMDAMGV